MKLKWLNKLNDEQLLYALDREEKILQRLFDEKAWSSRPDIVSTYIQYAFAYVNTCRVIMKARKLDFPPKKQIEHKDPKAFSLTNIILGY